MSTLDKYEYKVRAEEIKSLIADGEYAEAVKIADTIDWKRVKSVMMLCTISDLYKINRRFQESKDILLLAYERHPGGRLIVYSLCELSVKMGEIVQAIEYYKEFVQIAPKDTGRYILQYKLYEAQDVSLEERIAVLEEFKKRDYREKWAYELAYLYHRVGLETKCVEECDEMILWFGEGRYIQKALELKQLHQPLTPEQQDKYDMLKGAQEQPEQYWEEEPEEQKQPESKAPAPKVQELRENSTVKETAPTEKEEAAEEEFRVKTVDVGQYNTINLQKELAESMKEFLVDEPPLPERVTPFTAWPEKDEKKEEEPPVQGGEKIRNFTPAAEREEAPAQQDETLSQPEQKEESPSTEEVFFEDTKSTGDIKDVLLEDTKEINLGDAGKPNLKKKTFYPAASAAAAPTYSHTVHAPHVAKGTRLSGFEQMLSQEYDGQISLVVPDKSLVEKQITGQMNITDIMAEWERMKKENEEKRKEDVRKRVQQHTGDMFSEFDEATKTGLLEQLEKAVVDAIIRESGKEPVNPEDITSKKVSEIVRSVSAANGSPEADLPEDNASDGTATAENTAAAEEPAASEKIAATKKPEEIAEEATQEKSFENIKDMVEKVNRMRDLSEEEKELFGRYIHDKKAKQQIIHAVDTISMDSYTDNVILTGEDGAGTLDLAKGLIRMLQMSDANFSGKVAKISGETLNKKDVEAILSKLTEGALIIEHAAGMSEETATSLNRILAKENAGLLVILEDEKNTMNKFMDKNHILSENFNARIDIEALDDHMLVEYARQYAEQMEYAVDELGILALHTRIADMQTSDHEVTVAEVRELVDDAIYFADKKTPKHLLDILFGKRYDEEDMIILREKDFMHY